ncbi:biotin transporter BioY [Eubacteriales bacterium OttesenSCG-928-N13]|nr:biotin transporter BioY [Eubacteriales bacterium OttesenSCG-928-N13]
MKKMKLNQQARIAMMTAVLCVTSQWVIPTGGIPFTLQTFFVPLSGALLGPLGGAIAVLVYLLIGAVGVPVFSNAQAGFGVMLGATGGFLWSFPIMALLCSLRSGAKIWQQLLCALAGILVIYAAGTVQYMVLSGRTLLEALMATVVPFILKDVVCVTLGVTLGRTIKRRLGSHVGIA